MSRSAPSRALSRFVPSRAVRAFLGAILLTTCSSDAVGPHGVVVTALDAQGLFRAAAEFAIPIDEVVLEVRRASNDALVFSRTLGPGDFNATADQIRIRVTLELEHSPEDFVFVATARSGGIDYYQASGTITATAFETVTGNAVAPVYIGPGANADGIGLAGTMNLGNGQTSTLTAVVTSDGTPIANVPVSFQSSDSSLIIPAQQGFSAANVTAPATGAGTVTITARTPTGLSTTGDVSWQAVATQMELLSGDGQTVQPGANAPQPLAVLVLDANDEPVQDVQVTYAVTAGPTGTVITPTTTSSDVQGVAEAILTAGASNGPITVTATAAGLTGSPVTFSATVATTVGQPAVIVFNSQLNQSAPVNTAVLAPPSVIVRDINSIALPNIQVTFVVASGGGSITGAVQTTNASGVATVGSWTLGPAIGANTLTATVTGLPPLTFNATGTAGTPASITLISGDNQTGATATALAQPLVVEVRDVGNNLVSGATVSWTPTDGSAAPASGPTDVNGRAQTSWTLGANQLAPTLVAAVSGAGSVTFHATTTFPNPTILLGTTGPSLVGVGLSNTINVTLSQAAGVNGVNLSLSSDNTSILTVSAPTLNIPQGSSTGTFTITGLSAGTTTVRATAAGFDPGALSVTATLQIISLPATQNVPFGQNQNVPVSLALPAPAGGVTVAIASSDATRVAVVSPTVTIAQGSQVGTAVVFGQLPGPSTLTASATGFVTATSAATTTALFNIVQGSATLNASFGTTITIELRSGATTIPAPAGGLAVDLQAANPACVAVPATVTIPQGLVNVSAPLTYGGSAPLPCNTTVTASAPNIISDAITATVNVTPVITLFTPAQGTARLGNSLQDNASGQLQVVTPVATTVRVSSGDPSVLLIAPDDLSPGAAFIDIPMAANSQSFTYVVQGISLSAGPVTITAASPNFTNGTTAVTVAAPGLDITGLTTPTTSLAADDPFNVRIGVVNAAGTSLSALQASRPGIPLPVATITNSNTAAAKLVTSTDTADQVTVTVPAGATTTPGNVNSGGVALDARAAGVTAIQATIPGFVATVSALDSITINAPNISLFTPAQGTARVGNGLQDNASGQLQNPAPAATTVRISSGDPTRLLIAPNDSTAGSDFIDIPVAAGANSFTYFVQGIGISTGPVTITASSAGYNNGTTQVTIAAPGLDIVGLTAATTTFAANDPFTIRIGVVNTGSTGLAALQSVRAGATPVTATVTTSQVGVARLLTAIDTGASVPVNIGAKLSSSGNSVATGGVALDPLSGGTTVVNATIPGFAVLPTATTSVTVSAPNITLFTPAQGTGRLGNFLQDGASGSLQTATPVATTVRVSSGDPTRLLIAPNDSTVGSAFIDIPVVANGSNFTYFTQGVGVSTGPVTITASSAGYNDGTTQITVVAPGVDLSGLIAATTTFSATDVFTARIGAVNAAGTALSNLQDLQAGATPLTATFQNSNGTVAQLVTTATSGNRVTATIAPRQNSTPSAVAAGGVAFDPLVAGNTVVTVDIPGFTLMTNGTVNIAVTAPTISMSTPGQGTGLIGSGLQDAASGSLQVGAPGPLTVRVQSSNPQVALVSKDANTPGTEFIDIALGVGASSFNYYIQGVDGATGTPQILATAPGYVTGQTTANVVLAAVQLTGLVTSISAGAANPDPFQVIVGAPNATRTSMSVFQAVRAGGTTLTINLQNTNAAAGQLVAGAQTGQQVTVSINPGQDRSPSTVVLGGAGFDPIAQGTTQVRVPSHQTLILLPAASQAVTVTP